MVGLIFVGNIYVNLELIPGLNVKSTLGENFLYYGYESFTPVSYLNSSTITSQNNISRGSNLWIWLEYLKHHFLFKRVGGSCIILASF